MGMGSMSWTPSGSMPAFQARVGDSARTPMAHAEDADGFESLAGTIRPLFGPMERLSRRILRDDGLADDAVQETLITFWTCGETPANPRAWLLQAVTLRSLCLARTCRRRRRHEQQACLGRPERNLRDDPAQSLDHQDLLRSLHAGLDQIGEEYRAVFLLWAIEEMGYAEIAETLRIPIGTVRSRLSRSRRAIRATLAGLLDDHGSRTSSRWDHTEP